MLSCTVAVRCASYHIGPTYALVCRIHRARHLNTSCRTVMPVDQQMAMRNAAIGFGIPDMRNNARKFRVDVLHMLRINAANVDTEFDVIRLQFDGIATVLGDLTGKVDIKFPQALHIAKRLSPVSAMRTFFLCVFLLAVFLFLVRL